MIHSPFNHIFSLYLFLISITFFQMACQSQIMELSSLSPLQILETVRNLLDEGEFQQFTLVFRRKAKQNKGMLASRTSKISLLLKNDITLNMKCLSDISFLNGNGSSSLLTGMDDSNESPISRALKLYNKGDFLPALQIFKEEQQELRQCLKEGVEGVKLYQDAIFHIGNCYYRLKDYEKAIEYFSREFKGEQQRQRGQKYNNLGSCYAHLNQSRLSLKNYSQALKIYSDFSDIDCSNLLSNLGMLYAQSSMFQTAERYFLKSIEERNSKSPENSYALYTTYLHLGNCQKHSKKYTESIASLQIALSLADRGYGNMAEILMQLASLYELLEKWKEALDCYEKLSQLMQKKGYLYERAAHIHRFMGRFSDFDRFIQKAYECYKSQSNDRKLTELAPMIAKLSRK